MASSDFVLQTEWQTPAPTVVVWDAVADPMQLPQWWGSLFKRVEPQTPDTAPAVGSRYNVEVVGQEGQPVDLSLEITAYDRPTLVEFAVSGGWQGTWRTTLDRVEGITRVALDWQARRTTPRAGLKKGRSLWRGFARQPEPAYQTDGETGLREFVSRLDYAAGGGSSEFE